MKQSKTQQSWLSLCLVFAMVFSMVGGIIPTAFAEDGGNDGNDGNESVVATTLESITVDPKPDKVEYTVGEKFIPDGIQVTAYYKTGETSSSKEVTKFTCTFNGDTLDADYEFVAEDVGETEVTVSYTEGEVTKTATFDISVSAKETGGTGGSDDDDGITSYTIINAASKTRFYELGGDFEPSNLTLFVQPNVGDLIYVPLSENSVAYTLDVEQPFKTLGEFTITATYTNPDNGISAEPYKMINYVVESYLDETLETITYPTLAYTVGETINVNELLWKVNYENGSSKEVSFDNLEGGTFYVYIEYSDYTNTRDLEDGQYTFTAEDVGTARLRVSYTDTSNQKASFDYDITISEAEEEEPETTYTVYFYEDFDAYSGNINYPYEKEVVAEGKFVTPPTLTKTNFAFVGWYHIVPDEEGIDREVDWTSSTAITKDIRLIARWDSTLNKVTGRVLDSAGASVEGATVNFRQDGVLIDSTTTIANGYFLHEGLPTGSYHIEAVSGYNTRTGYYYVKSGDTDVGEIRLSPYYYTTTLTIDSTSPVSEVNGFEEMAEFYADDTDYRYDFQFSTAINGTDSAGDFISLYLQSDETLASVFDINIRCTATSMTSSEKDTYYLSYAPSLLSITLDLTYAQQGKSEYKIYHQAWNSVNTITTEPNEDGEYISVSGSKLTLYARNFSTFALVYNNADAETEDDDEDDDDDGVYTVALNTLYNGSYTNNSVMGTAFLSTTRPEKGDQVFVYTDPSFGYEVAYVKVLDSSGLVAATTTKDGTTYSFYQPSKSVNVLVAFVDQGSAGASQSYTAFNDVKTSDWFCYATNKVSELGLMYGTGNGNFSPYTTTTRGMIVTILHNMVGRPTAGSNTFSDVASGSYYEQAVTWANQYNIVGGYTDGTFRPDNNITREELAVMLYQYAKMYQSSGNAFGGNTVNFSDNYLISSWAQSAVAWCSTQKIFSGKQGNLFAPNDHSNRAEVAVSLLSLAGYGSY